MLTDERVYRILMKCLTRAKATIRRLNHTDTLTACS